ncbi:MAG: hypothetical protein ACKO3S_12420 [bacterium]
MARPAPAPTAPRRATLAELAVWVVPLVVALGVRLGMATGTSGLTMDSPLYVRMAEAFASGRHEPSPAHHGYPLLVALASAVLPGREWPGRVVSLVASLAVVVLVTALTRRRAGSLAGWVAGLAVALQPLLAVYGVAIMTESTFLALALAGVLALERGSARAGGAWLGAAWWVRPEAAVIAPLAVLLSPLSRRARVWALAAALLVALPYAGVLRATQGFWSLTPKTALVRAPFADARAAEWRLADSTAFADSVGVGARLARDGGAIVRAWPARFTAQAQRVAEAWPLPLLLLSLLGLARANGRGPWLAFAALPFVYPLLAAPAELRFAMMALPALVVPMAVAAAESWRQRGVWRWSASAGLVAGAALLATGPAQRLATQFDDGPMASLRGAGAWLEANSAPDAVIMDRKSYVPFFAHRRHVQLPDEPLDTLLDHAVTSGATHLVVEEYVTHSLRPQLAPLLDARILASEPRVRLGFATRPEPGEGVVVLEVVR